MSRHGKHRPSDLGVARARAVLAGATFRNSRFRDISSDGEVESGEPLEELAQLTQTAGGEVVARVVQQLARPNPGTFLGRGKVEEIARLVGREKADVVIFDHDLTEAQVRNLEKTLSCGVIERTELILGIFARRARTRQAKLQVELARLEYTLPRLRRMWTHLERQVGGIGLRGGPGERQIETDRRRIRRRISDLTKELRELESRRARTVGSREGHFTVSLVGYTNAGKSSLCRALTGRDLFVEDKLFATLDTKTGALAPDRAGGIKPPARLKILVSDTVGFIRNLPHDLIASFHATLEEARTADLLLHVVDVSHDGYDEQARVVESVLEEIDAHEIPTVVVLNKIDRLGARAALAHMAERLDGAVTVSALTGEGLGHLRERIVHAAVEGASPVRLRLSAADEETMRYLFNHGFNIRREYLDGGLVDVEVRLRPADYARLVGEDGKVEVLEGPQLSRQLR
jgi:GTP-binding protein HflX